MTTRSKPVELSVTFHEPLRGGNLDGLRELGFKGGGEYMIVPDEEEGIVYGLAAMASGETFAFVVGHDYDPTTGGFETWLAEIGP